MGPKHACVSDEWMVRTSYICMYACTAVVGLIILQSCDTPTTLLVNPPIPTLITSRIQVWEEYRECVEATGSALGGSFGDYLQKTYGIDAPDGKP